ncbi:hypothetical protein BB934_03815 [Microvirga ossetica]|uniref:Uncharacterized protein n=2 Tax=Microvirga ossetica TaxID=1882682 RepID=A0A1B2EBT3_9HYPH|nr:hypothetical protein BB934_03815 [Microvirga ossetica]
MVIMDSFDHILNWKLKRGSHTFPGQDGGTCINEAAIVAAGFPYQAVRSVHDMPKCFSRPICALAMQLNDEASDDERQQLLPFVTRLACADTREVEWEREAYITARLRWRLPFQEGMRVLEEALAIGRQADLSIPDEVRTRMEAVQARATILTSVPDTPLFVKIKKWFGTKEPASAG